MSFFKKLGDFCRKSVESSSSSSRDPDCCANCSYWGGESPFSMTEYTCCKHNFKFDPYDVTHDKIHKKKKCSDHVRKWGT